MFDRRIDSRQCHCRASHGKEMKKDDMKHDGMMKKDKDMMNTVNKRSTDL